MTTIQASSIQPHMEVIASDGEHIRAAVAPGTSEVDAVPQAGDRVAAPKPGGSEVDAKS